MVLWCHPPLTFSRSFSTGLGNTKVAILCSPQFIHWINLHTMELEIKRTENLLGLLECSFNAFGSLARNLLKQWIEKNAGWGIVDSSWDAAFCSSRSFHITNICSHSGCLIGSGLDSTTLPGLRFSLLRFSNFQQGPQRYLFEFFHARSHYGNSWCLSTEFVVFCVT